jgi:two-component system sensor histidine kinase HydH
MTGPSAAWSRWGLLLTTLSMGLALVATALLSYRAARSASAELLRARGLDLSFAVHRALHAAGSIDSETANAVLEETTEHGLRGLTILGSAGEIIASAGAPASDLERVRRHCHMRPGLESELDANGDNVQIAAPLMAGPGHGRHFGSPAFSRPWPPPPADSCLVMVLDPSAARSLVRSALTNLVIGLAVAVGSLVLAIFFWRLSRRAEAFSAEIARDRQLKALGEMSAVLGHEIRNPLASLKGHAQLLKEGLPSEDPRSIDVDTVVTEAKRLEQLVSEVLAFARTSEVQTAPDDPLSIARSAIDQAGAHNVTVTAQNDLGLWPLDRPRVEQVLANLLRNAAQASTPESQIELGVRVVDGNLEFSVRDHGPGIAPEDLDQIFEPFFTRRVRGTGLGLTIAKRIVQSHGGQISAVNSPDGGALFCVRLPRRLPAR